MVTQWSPEPRATIWPAAEQDAPGRSTRTAVLSGCAVLVGFLVGAAVGFGLALGAVAR